MKNKAHDDCNQPENVLNADKDLGKHPKEEKEKEGSGEIVVEGFCDVCGIFVLLPFNIFIVHDYGNLSA